MLHCGVNSGKSGYSADERIMPNDFDCVMEVIIREAYIFGGPSLRRPQMLTICSSEGRFPFLLSEEIDGMDSFILVRELSEMALECWQRGLLRTCNLDPMTKGLHTLLFPEHYGGR